MNQLITDLKFALVEIHEEEQVAKQSDNHLHANGLAQARILVESVLEKHGINRPARLPTEECIVSITDNK
ncbi:hypothetical protein [Alteromonas gilva]|uniref:Uncharacterized protein n=1 Tax=Alteromonas gilva TaxID=2987522 RepID=A0ABT5L7J7_9ALTE|nr:hypothetical protein [Alteromonas gilva]MDC8832847.1 hypothetical protein [Alteromonas gilva]